MKNLIFYFFLFGAPCLAWSAALTTPDPSCACRSNVSDPFEEPIRYNFGKFSGQCVNACKFRRARLTEARPGELLVANILHFGKYYQGKINFADVKRVEVGFERFATGIFHVFLRFELKNKINFIDQTNSSDPPIQTQTLILSSEAVPPKGHKFRFLDGYLGHYLIATRLLTGEELERGTQQLNHPVYFYVLNLRPEQAARILERDIRQSESSSFKSTYQLFENNCSTSIFALLDRETGFKLTGWNPFHWAEFEQALPIIGPIGTTHALHYRGLIDDQNPVLVSH